MGEQGAGGVGANPLGVQGVEADTAGVGANEGAGGAPGGVAAYAAPSDGEGGGEGAAPKKTESSGGGTSKHKLTYAHAKTMEQKS